MKINNTNAVTSVDNSANTISTNTQNITYTAYHQPSTITENNYELTYGYGPDYQRKTMELKQGSTILQRRIYLGDFEIDNTNALNPKFVHYITSPAGLVAIVTEESGTRIPYTIYTDHLGSIVKATNAGGGVVAEQNFDAWGRHRNPTDWTYNNLPTNPWWLYRGYTAHEHLPEFGLINMNGRMYDPVLGRMLSPDNCVQVPNNLQSYNRYSYCLNNPLKYIDPSGEEWINGQWVDDNSSASPQPPTPPIPNGASNVTSTSNSNNYVYSNSGPDGSMYVWTGSYNYTYSYTQSKDMGYITEITTTYGGGDGQYGHYNVNVNGNQFSSSYSNTSNYEYKITTYKMNSDRLNQSIDNFGTGLKDMTAWLNINSEAVAGISGLFTTIEGSAEYVKYLHGTDEYLEKVGKFGKAGGAITGFISSGVSIYQNYTKRVMNFNDVLTYTATGLVIASIFIPSSPYLLGAGLLIGGTSLIFGGIFEQWEWDLPKNLNNLQVEPLK